ncbi:MAG TPA: cell division protein FtsA [Candidatus Salinicoccus stercoripullorum]|uniref:Cell division protein FtsA n=1 Tax=Candidatus Salinicoccus stercoripullorum TaxID=2838756 RepID=A0A9D1QEV6_9STAP|nr:cell division protein FtsA [Candidatus Salinicoccus stercoripullorum]
MKEHYYVALDIGSASVKAVVGEKFHDGVNVIGTGQTFTDGVSRGMIKDFELARNAIKDTIKKAKISSGIEIDEVFLKMPITGTEFRTGEEELRFGGDSTEITGEHIEELLETIREREMHRDKEVITVFPNYFKVDDLHEVADPKEMMATQSLSVNAGIILISRSLLMNAVKCVEDSGLTVLDVYSDAVNYQHVLSESEVELGGVVIDIGADLTQFGYYERGALKFAGSLPVGGSHITNDLSEAFNTPFEIAEKVKHQYGHAFFDLASDEDIVKLPQRDGEPDIEVTPKDLADIIELRLEEMLLDVFAELQAAGITRVSGGFIVTGGTVNLLGVKELLQDLVSEKIRIHIPKQMGARKPEYASAISTISSGIMFDELLEYVTIDNYETEPEEAVGETASEDSGSFFTGLFNKRKENNARQLEEENNQYSYDGETAESPQNDEEYSDYAYEDDRPDETVTRNDEETKQPGKPKDYREYMKKLFKNLFE